MKEEDLGDELYNLLAEFLNRRINRTVQDSIRGEYGVLRYLKYIQKERYEYKYGVNRPINFDPLFDSDEEADNEVSQKIKDYYNKQLIIIQYK